MDTGSINYQWAARLIQAISLSGADQAVISPGSRSTPLTLACQKHPVITTHIMIDERCAAFFALGLAQQSKRPVIMVCTSGTAVANWLPAVIEASHSKTPLILLSADRPAELHNCGANQTINQQHIFGSHVRGFYSLLAPQQSALQTSELEDTVIQAMTQTRLPLPGPVHINVPFREPLLPMTPNNVNQGNVDQILDTLGQKIFSSSTEVTSQTETQSTDSATNAAHKAIKLIEQLMHNGQRGLIICGHDDYTETFAQELSALSRQLNLAVLVDPLSGLRFGRHDKTNFCFNYDSFLKNKHIKQQAADWVLRFGRLPVSKSLSEYLTLHAQTPCLLIEAHGQNLDPLHLCQHILQGDATQICQQLQQNTNQPADPSWIQQFYYFEQQAHVLINQTMDTQSLGNTNQKVAGQEGKGDAYEGDIIKQLIRRLPDHSILFSGNSMPIRDLDTYITKDQHSEKNIQLYCNRGASGIDGNLSTYAGLLATTQQTAIALIGDLSFYHDMNGLLMLSALSRQNHRGVIILLNNNGGGIFNYLPQQQLNDFQQLWMTATELDFSHAAALYQLGYYKVHQQQQFIHALDQTIDQPGIDIIEVNIDSKHSVALHQQLWDRLQQIPLPSNNSKA